MQMQKQRKSYGFTVVELFVVIIIIGILAVIALPSFVCAHKVSEAEQYTETLVRRQQAYFLEQRRFAESMQQLNPAVPSETENYLYSVDRQEAKGFVYARTKKSALKSYVGGVFVRKVGKELFTEGIVCVAQHAGTQAIDPPINAQTCGEGTIKPPRKKRC
jgi:type IV pilus assembly protein PilA